MHYKLEAKIFHLGCGGDSFGDGGAILDASILKSYIYDTNVEFRTGLEQCANQS
jgi:hypothetical protein